MELYSNMPQHSKLHQAQATVAFTKRLNVLFDCLNLQRQADLVKAGPGQLCVSCRGSNEFCPHRILSLTAFGCITVPWLYAGCEGESGMARQVVYLRVVTDTATAALLPQRCDLQGSQDYAAEHNQPNGEPSVIGVPLCLDREIWAGSVGGIVNIVELQ